ncbi:MAG TPA: hypothetical protein VHB74_06165 [Devosia sp.]|nr:hypothetical protein [Devosia sp.]
MPTDHEQGTGKHGHKDSQEPYPHTKDHEGKSASPGSHSGSHAGSQSHGSQSHSSQSHSGSNSGTHSASGRSGQSSGSEDASLKSREYRDENGEVHHHTKSYMDQHNK